MKKRTLETVSRFTAVTCAAILSSGFVLGGCAKTETAEVKDHSILVETLAPKKGNIELTGSFMGTVEAENEVTVIAKTSGDVTAVYFEEGDRVNAGDLLFTIDDRSAQIAMEQAQAGLDNAKAAASAAELNLDYTKQQIQEILGSVSSSQMQLENAVTQAQYTTDAVEQNADYAELNYKLTKENYEDLLKDIEGYKTEMEQATAEKNRITAYISMYADNYEKLRNATGPYSNTDSQLYGILSGLGVTFSMLGYPDDDTTEGEKIASAYLLYVTKEFRSIDEMENLKSDFEETAETAKQMMEQLKDSRLSAELAVSQSKIAVEQSKDNIDVAEDAEALAQSMLYDYNAYTKNTVQSGAQADLAGSESKVVSAQAGVKQAQASVDTAKLQLENTKVKAPISGVILRKNVSVNNMAVQGSEAYVIAADEGLDAVFYVAEAVMRELSIGQAVTVERNGSTYQAVITENNGIADAQSGLFEVKAQLNDGAESLIVGTSVKLTLATQTAKNVLTVPVDCVYYENQKAYVYCMQDGKAVKTEIETGITDQENVEVKSGLSRNSQVIVTWASQLKDGAEVKVKDSDGNVTETKAQEGSKTQEETKVQEGSKTQEETKAQEGSKTQEETKAQAEAESQDENAQ